MFSIVDTLYRESIIPGKIGKHAVVKLDYAYLEQAMQERVINIYLFSPEKIKVTIDKIETRAADQSILYGHISSSKNSTFIMVVHGNVIMANIYYGFKSYGLRYVKDGVCFLYEDKSLDDCEMAIDSVVRSSPKSSYMNSNPALRLHDDGSTIDIMVLYTKALKAYAGGDTAMRALIDLLIAEANQIFLNSGIFTRLNLVFSGEVDLEDTIGVNMYTTLYNLKDKHDGIMDSIHYTRDKYNADLVSLLVLNADGYAGIAYLLGPSVEYESDGFSVLSPYVNLAFTHEIGHNLGCNHDRSVSDFPGAFFYSHAYVFEGGTKGTVMSYHLVIPYFSNPDIEIENEMIGVDSSDIDRSADNVSTVNYMRLYVANFRNQVISSSFPDNIDAFKVYPVPTNKFVYIESDKLDHLELYNAQGISVFKKKEGLIDFSGLAPGIYFLNLYDTSGNQAVRKIIYAK